MGLQDGTGNRGCFLGVTAGPWEKHGQEEQRGRAAGRARAPRGAGDTGGSQSPICEKRRGGGERFQRERKTEEHADTFVLLPGAVIVGFLLCCFFVDFFFFQQKEGFH